MKTWLLLLVFAVLAYGTVQGAWYFAMRVANAQPTVSGRTGSVASTVQALRGTIELYKVHHNEMPPTNWAQLTKPTSMTGVIGDAPGPEFPFGPYLSAIPANPVNGHAEVSMAPSPAVGWVYRVNGSQYTVEAVNSAGDGVLTF